MPFEATGGGEMDLQEVRDLVVIIFGGIGVITFFAILVVTLVLGIALRGLIGALRQALQERVDPLLLSARETADNVRGATTFIADTVVNPIIRAYSIYAGLRRGLAILAGWGRRKGSH